MEQYFGENVSIFPLVVVNSEKLLCRHSGPVVNEFVFISRQVHIENQGYLLYFEQKGILRQDRDIKVGSKFAVF